MSPFISERVSWSATGRLWVLVQSGCVEEDQSLLAEVNTLFQVLSKKDQMRWERYRRPEKKVQFLLSRLAVSHVLNQEYGSDHRLVWESRPDGCPVLLDPAGQRVASVSLSHSRNVFVIGLDSPEYRTGVDCEVIEHVSANSVFKFLGNGMADEILNADETTHRWAAAMRWTEFEAEWKALQSGNTLEKTASQSEKLSGTGNRQSIGVPLTDVPLRTRGWRVLSGQRPDHETENDCAKSLSLLGPDACICVASDSLVGNCFLSDISAKASAGVLLAN